MNGFILWLAQGFGVGRIPVAPGTFGSVVGLGWFALLLVVAAGNFLVFLALAFLGVALSVVLCGAAEKILKQTDPGSVVMDEITAIPLCFIAWVKLDYDWTSLPLGPGYFFRENWPVLVGMFLAFRLFDVWKPWPVRQSQNLPGGWGVTVDDVLAAGYANACFLAFIFLMPARARA